MKFSVTKNGEPLSPELYIWDEKTKTLSTAESGLVLDFSGVNDCTITAGYGNTITAGDDNTITACYGNTITAGDGNTITAGDGNTITACDFNTITAGDGNTITACYGNTITAGYGNTITAGYGNKYNINGYDMPVPPIQYNGSRYPIGYHSPGVISSGCITKPLTWWVENVRRCAEENKYTPEQIDEYEIYVELLALWMKKFGLDTEQKGEGKQ